MTVRMIIMLPLASPHNSMTYGVSVRDLCIRFNPQALNVDERRLIQFGLLHNLIRRLHQYPVFLSPDGGGGGGAPPPQGTPSRLSAIHRLCNGSHSYDEICCRLGMTHKELHDKVERDPNIHVLWKWRQSKKLISEWNVKPKWNLE